MSAFCVNILKYSLSLSFGALGKTSVQLKNNFKYREMLRLNHHNIPLDLKGWRLYWGSSEKLIRNSGRLTIYLCHSRSRQRKNWILMKKLKNYLRNSHLQTLWTPCCLGYLNVLRVAEILGCWHLIKWGNDCKRISIVLEKD